MMINPTESRPTTASCTQKFTLAANSITAEILNNTSDVKVNHRGSGENVRRVQYGLHKIRMNICSNILTKRRRMHIHRLRLADMPTLTSVLRQ